MGITYAKAKQLVAQLYPHARLEKAFAGGKGGTARWAIVGVRRVELVKPDGSSTLTAQPIVLGAGHSFEAMFADAARKKAAAEARAQVLEAQKRAAASISYHRYCAEHPAAHPVELVTIKTSEFGARVATIRAVKDGDAAMFEWEATYARHRLDGCPDGERCVPCARSRETAEVDQAVRRGLIPILQEQPP